MPDMTAHGQRRVAFGFDLPRHRLAIVELAAGDDEVGAVVGERQRHLPAKTSAAASDKGHLAG